ncbi:MAG: glycosyltransferase family 2 protein, partial [Patescibacteria group bacterium]
MTIQRGLVSIGLPTYNRAALLRHSLDSLLAQTYKDFELIISDDGSTDNTQQLCEEYSAYDKRVRYIRHPKNIGHVINFEYVVRQARGEYFMWGGDDDLWDKRFIEKVVAALEANPRASLAVSSYQRVYSDGEI